MAKVRTSSFGTMVLESCFLTHQSLWGSLESWGAACLSPRCKVPIEGHSSAESERLASIQICSFESQCLFSALIPNRAVKTFSTRNCDSEFPWSSQDAPNGQWKDAHISCQANSLLLIFCPGQLWSVHFLRLQKVWQTFNSLRELESAQWKGKQF